VFWCKELGIKTLTVFALAKENLKRPKIEVDTLLNLCKYQFNELSKPGGSIERNQIKIKILGDITLLPEDVQEVMK
jgi:undecaprenyl diphosphate synthase